MQLNLNNVVGINVSCTATEDFQSSKKMCNLKKWCGKELLVQFGVLHGAVRQSVIMCPRVMLNTNAV